MLRDAHLRGRVSRKSYDAASVRRFGAEAKHEIPARSDDSRSDGATSNSNLINSVINRLRFDDDDRKMEPPPKWMSLFGPRFILALNIKG